MQIDGLSRALVPAGLIATIALAGLIALGGCGGSEPRPNVIIIVMDTMRADRLSCYGYERATSPSIDAFAGTADFYEKAFATATWTVPTHGSLFTGKLPFEHGAITRKDDAGTIGVAPLDESHLTLAEVFQAEGYRTGAFVANNGFLTPRFQFDQGFATYHVERVWSDVLNQRVMDWLKLQRRGPFFLWINYIDTHRVYNTTPRPGFLPEPAVQDQGELLDELYARVMPADAPVPAGLAQKVTDQYDTAVANLDEQIGALLQHLRDQGLYDDTIIVLTSDHGEYLGEHHLVEHSKDVYEEAVRAPLIVKHVGQVEGRRVPRPTSLADVPHLIFGALPAEFAASYRDEFPRDPARDPVIVENYYTRRKDFENPAWGHRFDRIRTVIYDWPYKYIHSSDGQSELYDLERDPRESADLITSEGDRATRMAERLADFLEARREGRTQVEPARLTSEEEKRLRSLGYIGD
jgi:arylsulfatase A-like enzyme